MGLLDKYKQLADQILATQLEAASAEASKQRQEVIADISRRGLLNSGIYFTNLLGVQKQWMRRICEARVKSYQQVLKEAGVELSKELLEEMVAEVYDMATRNAESLTQQMNQEIGRQRNPVSGNWAKNNFDQERDTVVSQIRRNLLIEHGMQQLRAHAAAKAEQGDLVFVVMSFRKDLDVVFEQAILPAIQHFGLQPFRVDREEFEETINQEILEKLRSCRFVVADLTYERPNCYYELGFAVGQNKRFVLCAREDHDPRRPLRNPDDPKVHFDVDSHKITYWSAESLESLRQSLIERIQQIAGPVPANH